MNPPISTDMAPYTLQRSVRDFFKWSALLFSALCLPALIAAPAQASIAYGSINNFDTVNVTGHECHGFEIEFEDCRSTDITHTYNYNHYGTPKLSQRMRHFGWPGTELSCSISFAPGSNVTVTATAQPGYHFVNWTHDGAVASNSASYTFAIDGETSFAEYAFGHDPATPDAGGTPGAIEPDGFCITYTRPTNHAGVGYEVELATDLAGPSNSGPGFTGDISATASGTIQTVKVRSVLSTIAYPRQFLRVRATQLP